MRRAYIKFIASLLLFGSNGIIAAQLSLPADQIVVLRSGIGSALLITACLVSRKPLHLSCPKRERVWLLVSGIAMGASWLFLYEAYRLVGVSISSLAYYCAPVIVMALSPLLFHERLTARTLAGFAAVLCGAVMINAQTLGAGGSSTGMFCGWMSALMHALMVIASKKADHVEGLQNATLQLAAAFALTAGFLPATNELIQPIAPDEWIWALALGAANTALGCYLYFSSYRGLSVQSVALLGYLEPLSAVVLSALLLGETLTPLQLVGAACILGGALGSEYARRHARSRVVDGVPASTGRPT